MAIELECDGVEVMGRKMSDQVIVKLDMSMDDVLKTFDVDDLLEYCGKDNAMDYFDLTSKD